MCQWPTAQHGIGDRHQGGRVVHVIAQRSRTLTGGNFLACDQLDKLFFAPAGVFGRANPNGGVEVCMGCECLLHGSGGLGFIVFNPNPKPRGV